jgi:glutamine cyclotransferase
VVLLVGVILTGLVLAACSSALPMTDTSLVAPPEAAPDGSGAATSVVAPPPMRDPATDGSVPATVHPGEPADTAAPGPPVPESLIGAAEPVALTPVVIGAVPHDRDSFTQGLIVEAGRMFESSGRYGRSTLREVDPDTGEVVRRIDNNPEIFAEGLELVDDRLIQLTWRAGLAYVWDVESFDPQDIWTYDGEGWGLCHDGVRFVMSDGSDRLFFRDSDTFEVIGSVSVTFEGAPVDQLNELECVDGWVLANVWRDTVILVIDPGTGVVRGVVDGSTLVAAASEAYPEIGVLNGIAFDEQTGHFHLTGKYWPTTFVVRLEEP